MLSQKISQKKNVIKWSVAPLTKHLRSYLSVHAPGRKQREEESQLEILW